VINPYKEAAPWARLALLVTLGAALLYGLGRWDQAISDRARQLEDDTRAALRLTQLLRAQRDSLRAIEDSLVAVDSALAVQERRATVALRELAALDRREMDSVAAASVASLLPALRLRPFISGADTLYATDETGVRVLAGRLLRLDQVERELAQTRVVATTRTQRIATLELALGAAQLRADTAEARVRVLEPLLERWQAQRECRILWLVPCPSRTMAFVLGAGVGVAGTLALGGL